MWKRSAVVSSWRARWPLESLPVYWWRPCLHRRREVLTRKRRRRGEVWFSWCLEQDLQRWKSSLEAENVSARRCAHLAVLADNTLRRSGSAAGRNGGKQPESNRPGNDWRPLPGLKPGRTTGCVCLPNSMSGDSRRACSPRFRLRLSAPLRSTGRRAAPNGHRRRGGCSRCGRNIRGSGSPAFGRPGPSHGKRGPR